MKLISFFGLLFICSNVNAFSFPKHFSDGMVLQAGNANIWGFIDEIERGIPVQLRLDCMNSTQHMTFRPEDENIDMFEFKISVPHEEVCDVTIFQYCKSHSSVIRLNNAQFGDVWVCSGQSNMEWPIRATMNVSQEIASLANYPNIKLFKLAHMTAPEAQMDLLNLDFDKWASTSETDKVEGFSAICILTAKYMADTLGKDKTFGLIETNWGGTFIEAWSTPEGLESCNIKPSIDETNPQHSNSYLFNAMISPLLRTAIHGALWYQGENNAGRNRDQYGCMFTTMIQDWRKLWNEKSGSNPVFPFGFVQLASIDANNMYIGTPMIRFYQTNGYGFVPNESMENVFMAVSLDTYDQEHGIHPTNKQIPSKRLATAGLNVAYGIKEYPTNGPFPSEISKTELSDGIQIDIVYDQKFTWNPQETEGFYICTEEMPNECNSEGAGRWQKIPLNSVTASEQALSLILDSKATAMAYLWETTPVLGTEALPIYADDEFKLPGAPWWTPLNF